MNAFNRQQPAPRLDPAQALHISAHCALIDQALACTTQHPQSVMLFLARLTSSGIAELKPQAGGRGDAVSLKMLGVCSEPTQCDARGILRRWQTAAYDRLANV